MKTWMSWTIAMALALGALSACSDDGGASTEGAANTDDDAPYEYVAPGKADDYRSSTGREYALVGLDTVRLSMADAELVGEERDARVKELVELRFKALSYFLYAYLAQKSRDDDNFEYGNFRTTIRQQTFEQLLVEERPEEPGAFDFIFDAEAAGPKDLMRRLELKDGSFELAVPKLSNGELASMSYTRQYKNFQPSDVPADQLEMIKVDIEPKESEADAYPEYARMFEDGLLDIAIHVGGDYNDKRYDLLTAQDLFQSLQDDLGLTAPVATFEELRSDSGPFVGEFDANGQPVRIEVTLIHPDMQAEEGVGYAGLLQSYRESAAKRDIVVYDGHAGYNSSYSGVVVHYNPRHAIAADDFRDMELPDKYQLFVFNGCKTYTAYPDSLYQHPGKDVGNLDIISTVNFSWLSEMTRVTTALLGHLVDTRSGTHAPRSYDQILSDINSGRSWDVIYGVHGLSDNPRVSPYADLDALCKPCDANASCPGADNLCVKFTDGNQGCAAACTDDAGCPDGYVCRPAARRGSDVISTTQCVPSGGVCQ